MTQDGQTEGRFHHTLSDSGEEGSVNGKLVVVTSPEMGGGNDQMLLECDVARKTCTAQAKFGTMAGGDYASMSFLQAVTPRWSVGGDASYIGVQGAAVGSYGARYAAPNWTACAQYSGMQGAVSANYKRVVTRDRVTLGAELQVRTRGVGKARALKCSH